MTFLVDANVLSETTKPVPDPAVVDWLRRNERALVVDPVVLGEIRFGILLLPRSRCRARLERWFDSGVERLHCLPWDAATGVRWAELLADLRTAGAAMPIKGQPDRRHRTHARTGRRHPEPNRLREGRRPRVRPVRTPRQDVTAGGRGLPDIVAARDRC